MPDFGFVGASYTTRSIYQDDQECINFYPEIDPTKQPGSRGIVALYPTPGLVTEIELPAAAEVRGMRALSGLQYAIVVCGNVVYRINQGLAYTQVGTLTTSSGPVSITDNVMTSQGLTAYIVDGVNRYYYVVATNTFVTLSASDGDWVGATVVDTVDNYIAYNEPGTQNWAVTDLGSPLSTTGLYGAKDGSPDTLVALIVDHRQVYLLGEVTSEVWIDVGSQIPGLVTFPFQRISGASSQNGIGAAFSIARFAETFMFLSRDTLGTATIGMMKGYEYQRVSTHAVENSLVGYDVSDARAWAFQIEGHEFYVISFPQIDLTWVYDLATQQWFKWLYWNAPASVYERHRAQCGIAFANKNLVGDYENGKIYSLDFDTYTDAGNPIRRLRRAPHLTTDLQRQFFEEFQIQFQPGVGLTGTMGLPTIYLTVETNEYLITEAGDFLIADQTTPIVQGSDPQAMLRWSNDGGSTWSNEHWTTIGKIGSYQNRAIWRRLGWSRDRIFEVAISDPVKAVIISANLKASAGDN